MGDVGKPSESDPDRDYGVLLGWKSAPAGNRFMLTMQSTRETPKGPEDVREFRYFITKQQAVLLGNYLYTIAGETAPVRKKRGLIERLFK